MIMSIGADLGELLVRHGGGRWAFDPASGAAVVEMPNELVAYPHSKLAKRLDNGPEHRGAPPGTNVRVRPDSAESGADEPPAGPATGRKSR